MSVKERKVYFMTTNRNKYEEVRELGKEYSILVEWLNSPKLEIQSEDLAEIVRYAALNAYLLYKLPIVVEDTGLFIKALNNFPGPYSSYVYKTIGLEGILKLMKDVEDRIASFITYVAFIDSKRIFIVKGEVRGNISKEIRGNRGFGFDPIFIPEGYDKTFGEMSVEEKNKVSHRAKAFRQIFEFLLKEL